MFLKIQIVLGVGISMNLINNYVNVYYIMILGYSLYYLLLSLNSELPWAKCNPKWASISIFIEIKVRPYQNDREKLFSIFFC